MKNCKLLSGQNHSTFEICFIHLVETVGVGPLTLDPETTTSNPCYRFVSLRLYFERDIALIPVKVRHSISAVELDRIGEADSQSVKKPLHLGTHVPVALAINRTFSVRTQVASKV